MSFFISDALAEGAATAAAPEAGIAGFLPIIVIFVLFYFLLIRPQTRRAKDHKKMVESLAKGDEVTTNGGILGTIEALDDSFINLKIADGVVIKIQRQAVAALMPKGTMKSGN